MLTIHKQFISSTQKKKAFELNDEYAEATIELCVCVCGKVKLAGLASLFLSSAMVALSQGALMYFGKMKPLNTSLSVQADRNAFRMLSHSD